MKRFRMSGVAFALWMTTVLPGSASAQIFGSDPEGIKRTDRLIKKAEDLVKQVVSARGEIEKTLDSYNAIFKDDMKNVRNAYKDVEGGMDKSEKQRAEVRKKLDEMKIEADAYFAGWSESLQEFDSENLRKRSESRMAETRSHFEKVLAAAGEARDAYEPFMTNLKDQWLYLGHDLNAEGIASLKPDAEELNGKAEKLFDKIDQGMDKANEYIESIRASRPIS